MKFSIKDFFSKCDQIRGFRRIRSHLLEKSFMENFIFCVVQCFTLQTEMAETQVWLSLELQIHKITNNEIFKKRDIG